MNSITKIVVNLVVGVLLGVALLFLTIVCSVAIAFVTNGQALIPGVFEAWVTTENEMPALSFAPNGVGMIIFIVAIAVIYTVTMYSKSSRERGSVSA